MATCNDCIHWEPCKTLCKVAGLDVNTERNREGVDKKCPYFSDNLQYVKLPCKIGDKVYRLSRQCGEWKILPRKVLCITYHGGTRWCLYTTKSDILGDNVFLTKEDAEAEVAKRKAKDETC